MNESQNLQPGAGPDKTSKELFDKAESRLREDHYRELGEKSIGVLQGAGFDRRVYTKRSKELEETLDKAEEQLSAFEAVAMEWVNAGEEDSADGENDARKEMGELEKEVHKIIHNNLVACGKLYNKLDRGRGETEMILSGIYGMKGGERTKYSDRLLGKISKYDSEIHELKFKSPEGYMTVCARMLGEQLQRREAGGIFETPYVKKNAERIKEIINSGRPVFLAGPLGTGKTELAMQVARDSMIERKAKERANGQYKELQKQIRAESSSGSSDVSFEEKLERFKIKSLYGGSTYEAGRDDARLLYALYRKNINDIRNEIRKGQSEDFIPEFISGSSGLDEGDLYATDVLTSASGKFPAFKDYMTEVEAAKTALRTENPDMSEDSLTALADNYVSTKYGANATVSEKILQPIAKAMREGRPVIIDEANAIRADVLISLNRVLGLKPGSKVVLPMISEPIEIRPGFSVIMTGNISSDSVVYNGTGVMNPALLSRLNVIEYDYPPMYDKNSSQQNNPEKNELFQIIVMSLLEQNGCLQLPDIEKTLTKLFDLALYANEIQTVFSGKNSEEMIELPDGISVELGLTSAVLSIRNILRVLEDWNKGDKKDLDLALWESFIGNITDPHDQMICIALAVRHGFFSDRASWNITTYGNEDSLKSLQDVYIGGEYQSEPMETYHLWDTIELLYGKAPERTEYPGDLDRLQEIANGEKPLSSLDIQEQIAHTTEVDELKKTADNLKKALDYFWKCSGCDTKEQ